MKEEGAISFPQNNFNRTLPEKFQPRSRPRLKTRSGTRPSVGRSPLFPIAHQTVPFPAFIPPSQIHPPDKETIPVFGKTMPVRRNSGHFTGFSGIARNRKTARHLPGVRLLELYSTLISVSDVKTTLRKQKPCRFLDNYASPASEQGDRGPVRARFPGTRIPAFRQSVRPVSSPGYGQRVFWIFVFGGVFKRGKAPVHCNMSYRAGAYFSLRNEANTSATEG